MDNHSSSRSSSNNFFRVLGPIDLTSVEVELPVDFKKISECASGSTKFFLPIKHSSERFVRERVLENFPPDPVLQEKLIFACCRSDLSEIEALIAKGANLAEPGVGPDGELWYPLEAAIRAACSNTIKYLWERLCTEGLAQSITIENVHDWWKKSIFFNLPSEKNSSRFEFIADFCFMYTQPDVQFFSPLIKEGFLNRMKGFESTPFIFYIYSFGSNDKASINSGIICSCEAGQLKEVVLDLWDRELGYKYRSQIIDFHKHPSMGAAQALILSICRDINNFQNDRIHTWLKNADPFF